MLISIIVYNVMLMIINVCVLILTISNAILNTKIPTQICILSGVAILLLLIFLQADAYNEYKRVKNIKDNGIQSTRKREQS